MNKRLVLNLVSRVNVVVCFIMLVPLAWAMLDGPGSAETRAFMITILGGMILSYLVLRRFPIGDEDFTHISAKDGLAVVGLSWICASAVGAFPFYLSGSAASYTDAFFETVSGFTTTGSSIMTDIEALPRGILFWRSLTHWLGGMGIIVLSVALLPALGRGAYQFYRAEAPGPTAERLRPKMSETARTLWTVYFIFTLAETVLLMAGDMPFFDALCHTFGTMATGGFSTKNASMAAYGPYIQWVVILFMFMAGINFLLHYQALRGKVGVFFTSEEFRIYLSLVAGSIILFTAVLSFQAGYLTEKIFRDAAFQIVAIITTTGFVTADFNLWPGLLKIILVLLMFMGGCAGSTGGGMKIVRVFVALKTGYRSIVQAIFPNAVLPVRIDSRPVSDIYIFGAVSYFVIFIFLFAVGTVGMTLLESTDLVTSFSASIAALSNIGPGLGRVGPVENYAWVSAPGKWMLSFLMLAGRLELYSILVLLIPATWKR
jgi:trk system potassium uptake protein TrkH